MPEKKKKQRSDNEFRYAKIREAASLYHAGNTPEQIGKIMDITRNTVYRWKKNTVWEKEIERLEALARGKRNEAFEEQWQEIQGAHDELRKLALNSVESLAVVQEKIAKGLKEAQEFHIQIRSLSDLQKLTTMLSDISKTAAQTFEMLYAASELQQFMADHSTSSVDIEFEEYSKDEINEIRDLNN